MELLKLRKSRGLLQREIAAAIGIAPTTYLSYEKNINEPSIEMLCKLADFFDVTVDELLGRAPASQLFDDARVDRPEILEIYAELTPQQQQNLLNYARGMAVSNTLERDEIKIKKFV